jgi:hypothetical protein
MGQLLKVEQNTSLVRDVSSNAILNNNTSDYQNYIKNKQAALSKTNELSRQSERINNLEQDMTEIKQMLKILIKGKE